MLASITIIFSEDIRKIRHNLTNAYFQNTYKKVLKACSYQLFQCKQMLRADQELHECQSLYSSWSWIMNIYRKPMSKISCLFLLSHLLNEGKILNNLHVGRVIADFDNLTQYKVSSSLFWIKYKLFYSLNQINSKSFFSLV